MDISQGIVLENKQMLSQTQIQSLKILTMDAIELEEFLQDEYINNPLLDCTSGEPSFAGMEHISVWDLQSYKRQGQSREEYDDDLDSISNIAVPDSDYLKNYLMDQLDTRKYTDRELRLCAYLIECLEDDGYLRMEPEQIVCLTGCGEAELEKVLADLRSLEPCGIFSQDLEHCLLRQLKEMDLDSPDMRRIVLYHLEDIAQGRISTISRSLSIPTSEVRKYISIIRGLNSKPLSGLRDEKTIYIVPDIIYSKVNGRWDIKIKDGGLNRYHLNDYYIDMMRSTQDPELKEYFKKKLKRCRFILNCIERRQNTMEAIARAILKKQEEYFSGRGQLKPMTMSMLAEEIQVHQSTVGRAIKGKYIQSPAGTTLIRNLFSGKAAFGRSGEGVTADFIKGMIVDIIDGEDKKRPYSDANIVEFLIKRGIHISRRAVAKYREELWIKSSVDRKER